MHWSIIKICTSFENFVFRRLSIFVRVYNFVLLYKFSLKSFCEKITKNLATETRMLQIYTILENFVFFRLSNFVYPYKFSLESF